MLVVLGAGVGMGFGVGSVSVVCVTSEMHPVLAVEVADQTYLPKKKSEYLRLH